MKVVETNSQHATVSVLNMTSVQNITWVELDFSWNQVSFLPLVQIIDSMVYGEQVQFSHNIISNGIIAMSSEVMMNQLELNDNSVSSLIQLSDCTFILNGTSATNNAQGSDGGVYRLMNSQGSLSYGNLINNDAITGAISSSTGEVSISHFVVRMISPLVQGSYHSLTWDCSSNTIVGLPLVEQ